MGRCNAPLERDSIGEDVGAEREREHPREPVFLDRGERDRPGRVPGQQPRRRHEDALRSLRRGLSRASEAPQAALAESQLLYELGDLSGAEQALRRALAVSPDWPDLHLGLARALRAQGQLEAAATAYERALELQPGYDAAALERAALALELARPEAARSEERRGGEE